MSSTRRNGFSDNPSRAEGTITRDAAVTLRINGYTFKGAEIGGIMRGNLTENAISATGARANGVPVTGNWMRTR